ncbi:MAG: nitroreductase [SAR202 cluster bacterium]|jgi:nitroreductase|nr:nitroreductase family protein [SAR202 cluster bacterium]MDP6665677.1 nitroreductase family protein [SAR202 cluster bacterium]MDP6799955.1 nitroreductase family protein [SAR202 cluster bacterium]MQG57118.1 nitroreductase [SAR202 cluster bacterium]MQG67350.1 nitroreductase [SAR202 cluster bacterium]
MTDDVSLFETMHTQRAIRHYSDRPVSDSELRRVLEAAIRAPNAGNRQQWRFLSIRDRETKRRFGDWYLRAWSATVERMGDAESRTQPYRSGGELAAQMEHIPVLVLACIERGAGPPSVGLDTRGATIYPAVQNLMLAARALGMGTVITTMHTQFEAEVKTHLGIPDGFDTAALIPLGYPAEGVSFDRSRRRPLEDVVFLDRWGSPGAV